MIGLMFAVSAWMVRRHFGRVRKVDASSATFFFLGAGFMLIETKGITELGLVFGNTWSVIAVAVSCVLLLGFLANLWVDRRGAVSIPMAFGLLAAALAVGWLVAHFVAAGGVVPMARLTMPVVLNLPLLFAGLIFSSLLLRTSDLGAALSANIFGAMLGGFLEYNSMYWGYASLYPIGLGLYGLAFVSYLRIKVVWSYSPGLARGIAGCEVGHAHTLGDWIMGEARDDGPPRASPGLYGDRSL
jgi:hypothetical protein